MNFSRPDYNSRIVECDVQALRELFDEVLHATDRDHEGRVEYRLRFVNCFDGKIPGAEPCFLVRGQDNIGHAAVRAWAHLHRVNGGSDVLYESALRHADAMELWAKQHGKSADGTVSK